MSAGSRTIWLGTLAGRLKRLVRLSPAFVVVCLAWHAGSSLWVYPHSLAYFNEAAGGPANGHKHLLHSNLDWGQDLLFLKDWLARHSDTRPIRLAYFGYFDPGAVGMHYPKPRMGPEEDNPAAQFSPLPGYYAVSRNYLHGDSWRAPSRAWTYLQDAKPIARAGYSIDILHIKAAE